MNLRLPLLKPLTGPPFESAIDGGATLQVGDLARECGKTVRAIHLYEELGLLTPQGRSKGRYRLYASSAVVRIRWIGKLQDMGFSLTDIQSLVRDWDDQRSATRTMAKMRELYAKKLAETQAHIRRLKDLEREIVSSIDYLDTCDVCEPERLVGSCTSCEHHAEGVTVPELVSGYSAAALTTPSTTSSSPDLAASAASSPAPAVPASTPATTVSSPSTAEPVSRPSMARPPATTRNI